MVDSVEKSALLTHLATGTTTVCRCWEVRRKDGVRLGFTDHDRPLNFDSQTFRPEAGMEAAALVQTTGLSVDNTESIGVLSSSAISEADIKAGRYDGAVVSSWLVNWADTDARMLQFRGTMGEVRRAQGAFQAELRGLTELLNQPQGFVYQRPCSAVLGDKRCGVDMSGPEMGVDLEVETVEDGRLFRFSGLGGFDTQWFTRGRLKLTSGAASGLIGLIKEDRILGATREIELWQELRAEVRAGDGVRLEAGCDRRASTCRSKFGNFLNFRGFPHIPGEDWLTSYPKRGSAGLGGTSYFQLTEATGG